MLMILHYLKIAWRNLLKYRTQTAVNVVGIAVGFACFAFANLWMHYEASFDRSYKGADRMYLVYTQSLLGSSGQMLQMPYPLSTLMKKEFPEVEAACAFIRNYRGSMEMVGNSQVKIPSIQLDSCFMQMFGIRILSGTEDFMHTEGQAALTESTARKLFGTTDILGRELNRNGYESTVCAVVSDLPHSNFSFGMIEWGAYVNKWQNIWFSSSCQIVIRLRPGVSPAQMEEKFHAYAKQTENVNHKMLEHVRLMPLSEVRQAPFNDERLVNFTYLVLFASAGGLVILCSLFNHLTLFLSRMDIRRRELSLRRVCGSTGRQLFALLATEYLLLILLAGFLGLVFVELCGSSFRRLSGVTGGIYAESFFYFAVVLVFSLFLLLPFVFHYGSLRPTGVQRRFSGKGMIVVQLCIGLLAVFCTAVLIKQLHYLRQTDLGWERHNIAAIAHFYPENAREDIAARIRQMPCTEEVLTGYDGLLPDGAQAVTSIGWEGMPADLEPMELREGCMDSTLASFYNIRLVEGEMLRPEEKSDKIMLNESAVQKMGVANPIGMRISYSGLSGSGIVVGVVRNCHTSAPTIPVIPMLYVAHSQWVEGRQILIKYHEGHWPELRHRVDSLFTQYYPEVDYWLVNVMDEYNAYLKAESLLLHLLTFVSIVCILVSAFGIFSMITLSCERRHKEVAIRKVNGARVGDILGLFAREYLSLLAVAAVVAFPVGYVLMKRWLESYVEQTSLSWWLYAVIFFGMALLVALCIGWRVWRAANENPAEVVKRE